MERTFKYSVTPYFSNKPGDTDLHCIFEVLECDDEELRINADDFMHQDLKRQIRGNPRIYHSLLRLAKDDIKSALIFIFTLTFYLEDDIIVDTKIMRPDPTGREREVIEDKVIGSIRIDTPVSKVSTLHRLRTATQEYKDKIALILKEDSGHGI